MLEPVAAEIVRDGEQEIVMVVMLRAERLDGLLDQPLVRGDLFGVAASSAGVSPITSRNTSLLSGIWR